MGDDPVNGRDDGAIRELQFGLLPGGLGLGDLGLGGSDLRLGCFNLCLGAFHRLAARVALGLRRMEAGRGGLDLLAGDGVGVDLLIAVVVLACLDQVGLVDLDIGDVLIDGGLHDDDLALGLPERRLRGGFLRSGLVELRLVVARIDANQHLAGGDVLVVVEQKLRDLAGDAGRHLDGVGIDHGIVRRFEMTVLQPLIDADHEKAADEDDPQDDHDRAPDAGAARRRRFVCRRGRQVLVARHLVHA